MNELNGISPLEIEVLGMPRLVGQEMVAQIRERIVPVVWADPQPKR